MGSITLSRHVIHDHKRFGALTVADVLAHSSDVGSIKLGPPLMIPEDALMEGLDVLAESFDEAFRGAPD